MELINELNLTQLAWLLTCENKVIKVSYDFTVLTEYTQDDIVERNLAEVFSILRMSEISYKNETARECYLFTKSYDAREVEIQICCKSSSMSNQRLYIFKEKENSRLEEKFINLKQFYSDNVFALAIHSVPDMVLLRANQKYLDFLGEPFNKKENSLGRQQRDITKNYDNRDIERFWTRILHDGVDYHQYEVKFNSSYLGETYWDIAVVPIYEEGKLKYLIEAATDITEQVLYRRTIQAQAEMIKKQNQELENVMKQQGEFFSFIAHEFRTPLTTMNSTLQLLDLLYSQEMTDNIKKYMNTLKRSTFQQLRLVNNLLDITRAESGYLTVKKKNYDIVSTTRVIVNSIKPYALAKNIKLKLTAAFEHKFIALDDEKYERILLNLVSNAIKFTPEKKEIIIKLTANNNKVFISIIDSGIGIPEDKQAIIFERFGQANSKRSRENEGTGIGLYLVKLLVESMGGNITLNSKENEGTTFIIEFQDIMIDNIPEEEAAELTNNRLVESLNMEFSNIYFE
ncbi:MAG: ATP-binding protein [Bacillota bacterium]|nr:ATP-binding protein [Bacillota bacterium]